MPPFHFLKFILILYSHLRLGLSSDPTYDYIYKNYCFNIAIKVV